MSNSFRSILPPRKKEWKRGDHQLGLFVRFPNGTKMEVTMNAGKPDEVAAALQLLMLFTRPSVERERADNNTCGCPNACPVHP